MGRFKRNYAEGNWLTVPLNDKGGYGLGLIARVGRGHGVLGYFFGPRLRKSPSPKRLASLLPEHALLIADFSDLHILSHRWQVLPKLKDWDRLAWPIPQFGRVDLIDNEAWRVTLNEKLETDIEERVRVDEILALPSDGAYGATAVEIVLTKLIATGIKSTVERELLLRKKWENEHLHKVKPAKAG